MQQAWALRLLPRASKGSGSHCRKQIPQHLIFKHVRNSAFSADSALWEMLAERGCSPPGIRNRTKPGSWPQRRRSPPDGWPWGRVLGEWGWRGTSGEAFLHRVRPHLWMEGIAGSEEAGGQGGEGRGLEGLGPRWTLQPPRNWKGVFLYPQTRMSPPGDTSPTPSAAPHTQEVWSRNSFLMIIHFFLIRNWIWSNYFYF